jgi:ribonucleoside-triphosphate reductase
MTQLPTSYQEVIAYSRYARYIPELKRRETWEETVTRLMEFIKDKTETQEVYDDLKQAILNLDIMPSMRLLMTAGEAASRDNIALYNCSYLAINNKRAFSEALYILMNGTGVGFSCERQEIAHLPAVPESLKDSDDTIVVGDSKLGLAKAFKKLLSSLWEGDVPKVDYSKVRPAGARLKTFGGRASGPAPLKDLFTFCIGTFKNAQGRKLNSLEVHDILCKIGEVVVVGGVRRSALISLSNLTDRRMREAKVGAWWETNSQRALANNSVAYTEKPDVESFMEEWISLIKSKSGERGIFSRVASQRQAALWGRRSSSLNYGTNQCSEIILRDKQFCNLSEVVVRATDTYASLRRKVELATVLGTIQSTFTKFGFLGEDWIKNTEEERLLGVSLTGIMDNEVLSGNGRYENDTALPSILESLRDYARETNRIWAEKLGIQPSAAITCVKPSGTVSQLVDSASGIHPRYSPFYIRTIRQDIKDPITRFLIEQGVPNEPDITKPNDTVVFSFPMKAPENAITRNDRTALEQLELWLIYQRHWCEHKPSITVYVKDYEWLEVGAWVYKHFDEVSGISFLPHSDHTYQQAPYQEIDEATYTKARESLSVTIDWTKFLEEEDNTVGMQTLACVSGVCEI